MSDNLTPTRRISHPDDNMRNERSCRSCVHRIAVDPVVKRHAGLTFDGLCNAPIPTPNPDLESPRLMEVLESDGKHCPAYVLKPAKTTYRSGS
jgi:hypothetical protein